MSDYVKRKVIRLPFPQSLIDKLGVNDCWECCDYLKEKFGELGDKRPGGFDIEFAEKTIILTTLLITCVTVRVNGVFLGF